MYRPKIVIIGAGFGGLAAAKALSKENVDVTIIDRNNFHTFLPLLYQVSSAEIEESSIIRGLLSVNTGLDRKEGRYFLDRDYPLPSITRSID